jgi:endonuclease IV
MCMTGIKANRIIKGLNEVLTHDHDVRIALETMAGKGTEIGRSFEELARIIDAPTCAPGCKTISFAPIA